MRLRTSQHTVLYTYVRRKALSIRAPSVRCTSSRTLALLSLRFLSCKRTKTATRNDAPTRTTHTNAFLHFLLHHPRRLGPRYSFHRSFLSLVDSIRHFGNPYWAPILPYLLSSSIKPPFSKPYDSGYLSSDIFRLRTLRVCRFPSDPPAGNSGSCCHHARDQVLVLSPPPAPSPYVAYDARSFRSTVALSLP